MIKKLALIIGFIICLSSCGKDYVYRIEGELLIWKIKPYMLYLRRIIIKWLIPWLVRNPGSSRSIKMKRVSIV